MFEAVAALGPRPRVRRLLVRALDGRKAVRGTRLNRRLHGLYEAVSALREVDAHPEVCRLALLDAYRLGAVQWAANAEGESAKTGPADRRWAVAAARPSNPQAPNLPLLPRGRDE